MNGRDFEYIVAVADLLSFNKAADACHVSQPTLSMQIRKLEEYVGVRLFERSNKKVLVTEEARPLIEVARRIVQDQKAFVDYARRAHDPYAGVFRIGAFPTLASYVFPRYVPALIKAFPKMQPLLVEEKTEALLKLLESGELDAALLALPINSSSFESCLLFEDPFYLAVDPSHELARRKRVKLDDLKGHRLLLLNEGHCFRDQALDVCHAHGAEEEKGFRATSLETLRLMVRSSEGRFMTLMPDIARSSWDGLIYLPFVGAAPKRRLGLVWRKTFPQPDIMVKIADVLRRASLQKKK